MSNVEVQEKQLYGIIQLAISSLRYHWYVPTLLPKKAVNSILQPNCYLLSSEKLLLITYPKGNLCEC
jgi:hypothetical protein